MKPLKLRMQAFGPYQDVAEIDFRDLSLGGLFLIHGPTGAGKTSILDGLCFALFGKSSGSERSAEGLRSDLAPTDLPTEVSLEFSLGLQIYKITRRPKQEIKKQRGVGLTTAASKGELYRLERPQPVPEDADWELVCSGDKKTDEKISELLGMTEEQFRQVVVLPQGQFRKFLSSTSEERERLLEKLFRTGHYRDLVSRFQMKADESATRVGRLEAEISSQLSHADCGSSEELQSRLAELTQREAELRDSAVAFNARMRDVLSRRERAREVQKIFGEHSNVKSRRAELETRRDSVLKISERLENERRARPVLVFDRQVLDLERDLEVLALNREQEAKKLAAGTREEVASTEELHRLEEQAKGIEAARASHAHLQQVYKWVRELNTEVENAARLKRGLDSKNAQARKLEEKLSTARTEKTRTQAEIQNLQERTAAGQELRLTLQRQTAEADQALTDLEESERIEAQICAESSAVEKLEEERIRAKNALDRLKIQFHLSQAAELAKNLSPDEPCPVCGSRSHPHLATTELPFIPRERLEQDESSLVSLSEKVAATKARIALGSSDLAKILGRSRTNSIESLRQEGQRRRSLLVGIQNQVTELERGEEQTRTLIVNLQRIEKLIDGSAPELRSEEMALESLRSQHALSLTGIKKLQDEIPPDLRDLETITRTGQTLRLKIESFETHLKALRERNQRTLALVSATRAKLETFEGQIVAKSSQKNLAEDHRAQALKKSGFNTWLEARGATLSAEELESLEESRRAFENESLKIDSRMMELEKLMENVPAWALDPLAREREFEDVQSEQTKRLTETGDLARRLSTLRQVKDRLSVLTEDLKRESAHYAVVGKLAAVALGQPPFNLARVNFPRFVLSACLEEVLIQASRRLSLMSRGQFNLRRSQHVEDKRKTAGLDLEVEDTFTGTSRPTASLSGGEGFLASLSLALGLADVVQSRLGGVRLDAVFVDEGFGTLDAEALELAIKTLAELQAGGRLVGIISHVPELRDQITRRLVVKKSARGSRVDWDHQISGTETWSSSPSYR